MRRISASSVASIALILSACAFVGGQTGGVTPCETMEVGDHVIFSYREGDTALGVSWILTGPGDLTAAEDDPILTDIATYRATQPGGVLITAVGLRQFSIDGQPVRYRVWGRCSFNVRPRTDSAGTADGVSSADADEPEEEAPASSITFREESVIVEADGFLFAFDGREVNGSWTLIFNCPDGRCDATMRISGTNTLLQAQSQGAETIAFYDASTEAYSSSLKLVSETPNGTMVETHEISLEVVQWSVDGPAVVDVRWKVNDDGPEISGSITWEGTASRIDSP